MAEPHWLTKARADIGVGEIVGAKHSLTIMGLDHELGSGVQEIDVTDDESPWRVAFMSQDMKEAGGRSDGASMGAIPAPVMTPAGRRPPRAHLPQGQPR